MNGNHGEEAYMSLHHYFLNNITDNNYETFT